MKTHAQVMVDKQACDGGLWFVATTAPEAYLQQELRRLHAAVYRDTQERRDSHNDTPKQS